MTQKDKTHINNKNQINEISNIDIQNISILKNGIGQSSFDKITEEFGEIKSESVDTISRVLSNSKTKISDIEKIEINIKNIFKYDERDEFNTNIQNIVSQIFLKKLWNSGKTNSNFVNIFEWYFWNLEKLENKTTYFKEISARIDSLMQNFPDIVEKITVSNKEIFEKMNQGEYNINTISTFDKQQISDQKMICEIMYWQNKDIIKNYKNHQSKVSDDLKKINNVNNNKISIKKNDDRILIEREKEELHEIWWKEHEIDVLNKKIRDIQKENMRNDWDSEEKIKIFEKLIDNDFNFWELSGKEQNLLLTLYTKENLLNLDKNLWIKSMWIDVEWYKDFVNDLMDFEQKNQQIKIDLLDWNEINLDIQKWFVEWPHKRFLDVESFENTKNFPTYFDINIDNNSQKIIDLLEDKENVIFSGSKNHNGIFNSYYTKNGEIRLWNNYDIEIAKVKINRDDLDKLFGEEQEDLEMLLKKLWLWEWTQKIFSQIVNDKSLMETLNAGPINWSIFEEMLKQIDIKILSKKIKLDGSNIDKLSLLYTMWNAEQEWLKRMINQKPEKIKWLLNDFSKENERHGEESVKKYAKEVFDEIEENAYQEDPYYIFDDVKSIYEWLNVNDKEIFEKEIKELSEWQNDTKTNELVDELIDHLHGRNDKDITNQTRDTEQKEQKETEEEKFMKERESLWWNHFEWEKDKWFRIWTRIFINGRGSKLPPKDIEDSFFEFEITEIKDNIFKVKVIWNEIESEEIWKVFELPKTEEHLNKMKQSGSIYKVAKWTKNDWNKSIENIVKSKIFNKITVFGTQQWQIKLKDGNFLNNEWEKIVSFGRSADVWSGEDWKQKKEHTTYQIKKIDNSKWTIQVSCNFEWKNEKDLSKSSNYKYNRELTYEQFILLMESKKVRGYTKDENEERKTKYGINGNKEQYAWSANKWIFEFYSLAAFANSLKNGFKKITDVNKKITEEQTENFENLLYSRDGLNLYSKLWSLTSFFGIFPWTAEAFDRAQLEFYNERDNRTWKKIEIRYKMFEADPHFASMRWEQMEKLLVKPGYAWKDKNRHKMAAAFLMLMKKDGPYGRWWLLTKMWKWHWVQKFLGEEHLVRYNNLLAERKRQLEEYKDVNHVHRRKTRQEELNRLEFDYMVWVMDGRQPFGWNYQDDEFVQASIRSRKFATTLDEHSKSYFSSFKKRADEVWTISFRQAEQEYFRMITAGRIQKALPFLKRMIEDAQNKWEESRAKMYFLWAMLTGIIKNGQDASVMTEFWTTARTMWLLPGIWCRDTDQADKVQKLLDWITSKPPFESFTKTTKYKKADFEPWTFSDDQVKMKFLSHDLPQYREKYGDKILDVLEFRDMKSENSIINLAEKWDEDSYIYQDIIDLSRENTKEDINKNVSYTYWYYSHSPRTANKWVVDWLVPRNWDYTWKETIERESSQEFWKSVASSFNTWKQDKKWVVEFYLGKFSNWFDHAWDQSSVNFMMRWLSLVKELKKNGKDKEAKYQLWYLIKWNLHEKLWSFPGEFGAVVDKFVEFFDNNIEMIDDKSVRNTFGDEAATSFNDSYGMLNWQEFYNKYMAFEWFGWWKEKSEYQKKYKRNEENYINWKIDNIKKNLTRKWISGQPIAPNTNEEISHKTGLLSRVNNMEA